MNPLYKKDLPFTVFAKVNNTKSGFALVNTKGEVESITSAFLEKVGMGDVSELPLGVNFDATIMIKDFGKHI